VPRNFYVHDAAHFRFIISSIALAGFLHHTGSQAFHPKVDADGSHRPTLRQDKLGTSCPLAFSTESPRLTDGNARQAGLGFVKSPGVKETSSHQYSSGNVVPQVVR
jgi:hypothetical protein